MGFKKLEGDLADKIAFEHMKADTQKQEALLGYVAMMADVEIPEVEDEQGF